MRIKFFGTGSAFTLKNYQSNIGIEHNGKWLLLDAGGDIRFSLQEAGLNYKNIDSVYISHLHADHSGGIEYLAFCKYFDPSQTTKIKLFGNGELLRRGWEDSWKGGLESIQGKLLELDDFFDMYPVKPNSSFTWGDSQYNLVQSIHIMNGYSIVPCYGLMIKPKTLSTKTIFWTSDCQFCPNQIMDFYKQATFIIQDCETTPFKSGVHANFLELETLPDSIKEKMILLHYQDNVLDNSGHITEDWADKVSDAGFYGFATKGQEIDLEELIK
jgi:hypothetical protein